MLRDVSIPFYLSYAALWIVVVLQSLILLGVVRIVYQLQQTGTTAGHKGLYFGEEAPAFSAVDLSGKLLRSTDFAGRLRVLLFVSPSCPACMESLEDMEYLHHKAQGNVIVICRAGHEDCTRLAEQYGLSIPIVADEDDHLSRLYGISSVPTAVLINANDHVQSYGQPPREELEGMFERASGAEAQEIG